MVQKHSWENEYNKPQLLTLDKTPSKDLKVFLKFLKKVEKVKPENLTVLDLGSGTGRNANYLAELGNTVVGLDISSTAVEIATQRAKEEGATIDYRVCDIGQKYPLEKESFDLVLDIMSSNSLNEAERAIYIQEVYRVLKKGGYFFVRALCKDGDKNIKNLLKTSPGQEYDTYIIKEMNLVERAFSKKDFVDTYSKYFSLLKLTKKTNYTRFNGRIYKHNYWLAYMRK